MERREYSLKDKAIAISASAGVLVLSILGCRYLKDNTGIIPTPQGIVESGPTPNQTLEYYEALFDNTPTPTSEFPGLTRIAQRATTIAALTGTPNPDAEATRLAELRATGIAALSPTPEATSPAPQAPSTQ